MRALVEKCIYCLLHHSYIVKTTLNKWRRKDTLLVLCGATLLVLFFSYYNFYTNRARALGVTPLELSFFEGVLCICGGILCFTMGGGITWYKHAGINWYTWRHRIYLSLVDLIHPKDTLNKRIHKSERALFQRDFWKSIPHVREGLSLIIAGIILIAPIFLIPE